FRSRQEVVDGVNFLFKQLMSASVAEMDYDEAAQLVCGAAYPPSPNDCSIEVLLVDKTGAAQVADDLDNEGSNEDESADSDGGGEAVVRSAEQEEQTETAQLEARLIAQTIRRLR